MLHLLCNASIKLILPNKEGNWTQAGPGLDDSAAIFPRLTVGVHGLCSNPAPMPQRTNGATGPNLFGPAFLDDDEKSNLIT